MDGLEAVLHQRTAARDDRRTALAELLRADSQWAAEADRLETEAALQLAEVAGLGAAGRGDVRAAAARRYHALQLRRDASVLDQQRAHLGEAITAARADLATADASRRAVERLIEQRSAAARVAAERRAQRAAEDEFASRAASLRSQTS